MVLQKEVTESFSIGNTAIGARVSEKSFGKLFQLLSNQYSDKESVILQEITANSHDSYKRIKKQGIVTIKFDSTNRTLHIIDNAEGISPEVFNNYIVELCASSKELELDSAGMLGVGNYVSWCLVNCFYLNTIHNGIKYIYSCTKRDYEVPEFSLLLQEETTEENGTDYWFYLPNSNSSYRDTEKEKFEKALYKLRYFENVVVEGLVFNNDYQIIQGKTFVYNKVRDVTYGAELEICFGNTPYPINWEKIDIPKIKVPFALKFELNEPLMILPSREALGWNNSTIECVKNKIIDFVQEITEMYKEQTQPFDNIFDYLEAINNKAYIKIADYKVDISDLKLKSELTYSKIAHLDLIVPETTVIFEQYDKHWDSSYTKKRSYKSKPHLWDKRNFYYSNEGLKKNKTSQIYFDCILKYNPLPVGFEDRSKFFKQKLGHVHTYPENAIEQIEEFYSYIKDDVEARYKDYDSIVPAKRQVNTYKRENTIYHAAKNGELRKSDYSINNFVAPKYLFVTENKEEYLRTCDYVKDYIRYTKDGKSKIVEVIYCSKKYHKLFNNVLTLEEWFKSDMFINIFRRTIQKHTYFELHSFAFLSYLKEYNKRLWYIHKNDSFCYNGLIVDKGLELNIPYKDNYQELKEIRVEFYKNFKNPELYRKNRIIQFLRNKLNKKLC